LFIIIQLLQTHLWCHMATLDEIFWSTVVCQVDGAADRTFVARPVPSFENPFRPHLESHTTDIKPFSFEPRTQEMLQHREQLVNAALEQEDKVDTTSLCNALQLR